MRKKERGERKKKRDRERGRKLHLLGVEKERNRERFSLLVRAGEKRVWRFDGGRKKEVKTRRRSSL